MPPTDVRRPFENTFQQGVSHIKPGSWACPSCTLMNGPDVGTCGACNRRVSRRTSSIRPQDAAPPPDGNDEKATTRRAKSRRGGQSSEEKTSKDSSRARGGRRKTGRKRREEIIGAGKIFSVERILDVRVRPPKRMGDDYRRDFLVRWEGYNSSQDTWEPEDNFLRSNMIQEFETKHQDRVDKAVKRCNIDVYSRRGPLSEVVAEAHRRYLARTGRRLPRKKTDDEEKEKRQRERQKRIQRRSKMRGDRVQPYWSLEAANKTATRVSKRNLQLASSDAPQKIDSDSCDTSPSDSSPTPWTPEVALKDTDEVQSIPEVATGREPRVESSEDGNCYADGAVFNSEKPNVETCSDTSDRRGKNAEPIADALDGDGGLGIASGDLLLADLAGMGSVEAFGLSSGTESAIADKTMHVVADDGDTDKDDMEEANGSEPTAAEVDPVPQSSDVSGGLGDFSSGDFASVGHPEEGTALSPAAAASVFNDEPKSDSVARITDENADAASSASSELSKGECDAQSSPTATVPSPPTTAQQDESTTPEHVRGDEVSCESHAFCGQQSHSEASGGKKMAACGEGFDSSKVLEPSASPRKCPQPRDECEESRTSSSFASRPGGESLSAEAKLGGSGTVSGTAIDPPSTCLPADEVAETNREQDKDDSTVEASEGGEWRPKQKNILDGDADAQTRQGDCAHSSVVAVDRMKNYDDSAGLGDQCGASPEKTDKLPPTSPTDPAKVAGVSAVGEEILEKLDSAVDAQPRAKFPYIEDIRYNPNRRSYEFKMSAVEHSADSSADWVSLSGMTCLGLQENVSVFLEGSGLGDAEKERVRALLSEETTRDQDARGASRFDPFCSAAPGQRATTAGRRSGSVASSAAAQTEEELDSASTRLPEMLRAPVSIGRQTQRGSEDFGARTEVAPGASAFSSFRRNRDSSFKRSSQRANREQQRPRGDDTGGLPDPNGASHRNGVGRSTSKRKRSGVSVGNAGHLVEASVTSDADAADEDERTQQATGPASSFGEGARSKKGTQRKLRTSPRKRRKVSRTHKSAREDDAAQGGREGDDVGGPARVSGESCDPPPRGSKRRKTRRNAGSRAARKAADDELSSALCPSSSVDEDADCGGRLLLQLAAVAGKSEAGGSQDGPSRREKAKELSLGSGADEGNGSGRADRSLPARVSIDMRGKAAFDGCAAELVWALRADLRFFWPALSFHLRDLQKCPGVAGEVQVMAHYASLSEKKLVLFLHLNFLSNIDKHQVITWAEGLRRGYQNEERYTSNASLAPVHSLISEALLDAYAWGRLEREDRRRSAVEMLRNGIVQNTSPKHSDGPHPTGNEEEEEKKEEKKAENEEDDDEGQSHQRKPMSPMPAMDEHRCKPAPRSDFWFRMRHLEARDSCRDHPDRTRLPPTSLEAHRAFGEAYRSIPWLGGAHQNEHVDDLSSERRFLQDREALHLGFHAGRRGLSDFARVSLAEVQGHDRSFSRPLPAAQRLSNFQGTGRSAARALQDSARSPPRRVAQRSRGASARGTAAVQIIDDSGYEFYPGGPQSPMSSFRGSSLHGEVAHGFERAVRGERDGASGDFAHGWGASEAEYGSRLAQLPAAVRLGGSSPYLGSLATHHQDPQQFALREQRRPSVSPTLGKTMYSPLVGPGQAGLQPPVGSPSFVHSFAGEQCLWTKAMETNALQSMNSAAQARSSEAASAFALNGGSAERHKKTKSIQPAIQSNGKVLITSAKASSSDGMKWRPPSSQVSGHNAHSERGASSFAQPGSFYQGVVPWSGERRPVHIQPKKDVAP